jgi:pyruvate dehydrogenase E2 component (dihydrolipoamide acetyltransferase)
LTSAGKGFGPNGRIVSSDIERAVTAAAPAFDLQAAGEEFSDQPVSGVRRLIAKAMHQSLQNSAQLTHHMSADVRKLLEARTRIKASLAAKEPGARILPLMT